MTENVLNMCQIMKYSVLVQIPNYVEFVQNITTFCPSFVMNLYKLYTSFVFNSRCNTSRNYNLNLIILAKIMAQFAM